MIRTVRYHHRVADPASCHGYGPGSRDFSYLNRGGTVFVADLDPDNGESHGPEMTVHPGFVRADLVEIFRNAGFTGIHVEGVATLTKASSKKGTIKEFPVFLMTAHKAG